MIISFTVVNQKLTLNGSPYIVGESLNYLEAEFAFSADWDGLVKYAHFIKGDANYETQLVSGRIPQSAGLNLEAGTWVVSVHGVDVDGETVIQRITTNTIHLVVIATSFNDGEPFPEIGGSIGEQILLSEAARVAAEIVRQQSAQRLLITHAVADGDDVAEIEWSQADDETPLALKNAEVRIFVPANSLPVGTGATISLRVNDIVDGYHGTISDAYTSAFILSTLRTLYGIVSCDLKVIGEALLVNAFFLSSDGTSRPTGYRPSALLTGVTSISKINLLISGINFPAGTIIEIYGRTT